MHLIIMSPVNTIFDDCIKFIIIISLSVNATLTSCTHTFKCMTFHYVAIECDRLTSPINGGLSFSPDNFPPYDYGTIVTYLCNVGWYRSGVQTRQCLGNGDSPNGIWNGFAATCLGELHI